MANDASNERQPPRYRVLAEALIGEIVTGAVAVGERLPGELELTRRFGVSRHTVREALRVLEELGLVGRRPGVGTVVRSREIPASPPQRLLSLTELLRYPGETRLQVLGSALVTLDEARATRLGCAPGEQRLRISGVRRHVADGAPICWTEVYLWPAHAAIAGLIGEDSRPVYRLLEERFGERPHRVEVQISARALCAEHAAALYLPEGSASLQVVRRYRNAAERLYEVSVSDHPADRISYTLQFQPEIDATPAGE
jgi:GntR family transcriptional regulator